MRLLFYGPQHTFLLLRNLLFFSTRPFFLHFYATYFFNPPARARRQPFFRLKKTIALNGGKKQSQKIPGGNGHHELKLAKNPSAT